MNRYLSDLGLLDPYKVREEFLVYKKYPNLVYLDSAASSLVPKCVTDSLSEYLNYNGSNVHRGVYNLSYEATLAFEEARNKVAKFINANVNEIVFTRGATEALNMVSLCYAAYYLNEGDHILTTLLEHHSSHLPFFNLAKERGLKLNYIDLDSDARITFNNFLSSFTDKTRLIVITHVSNVMGYISPLKEIIKYAHQHNCLVLLDAAQSAVHLKIDVRELDVDFLAFSGHKIYGPNGVGVLYAKTNLLKLMKPLHYGGEMAEDVTKDLLTYKEAPYKFEAGTPMIAEAIGLGKAIDFINSIGFDNICKHENKLHQLCLNLLSQIKQVTIYNKTAETAIITFNINGVHPHDAASVYDSFNVCLRAGHHCARLITNWLKVDGTLRIAFSIYNTEEDVYRFIEATNAVIKFFC